MKFDEISDPGGLDVAVKFICNRRNPDLRTLPKCIPFQWVNRNHF